MSSTSKDIESLSANDPNSPKNEHNDTSQIKNKGAYHPDDLKNLPPDGGRKAWATAFCSMLLCFSAWGSVSAYSVFINFYLTHNLLPGISQYDYALIAGLTMCMLLLCGWVATGLMVIFDIKIVTAIGTVLQFVGMLLASFAVNYWQLILTQGILSGVGCGILFSMAVNSIPSWFLKKRTIASGLQFAGTGLGGCVFALVANAMIEKTGDQKWALRAIAIISLFLNTIACLFISVRVSFKDAFKKNLDNSKHYNSFKIFLLAMSDPVKYKVWFSYPSILTVGYFCISSLGYIIILYSLGNFAVSVGLTAKQSSNVLAIMNAFQFIGRLAIGIAGDRVGRVNISVIMSFFVVLFTFAFWIPITTYAQVIAFSIMIGLVMGYQFVTISPIIADFHGFKNFGAAWCFVSINNSIIGLTAEVMALALKVKNAKKPYLHAQIFTGCVFILSTIILLGIRELKIRNIITQWKAEVLEDLAVVNNEEIDEDKQVNSSESNDYQDKGLLRKDSQENQLKIENSEKLKEYDELLKPSVLGFLKRVVYPIIA